MLSPLSLKVLRFCCFQLSTFGEIKAHSLRTTPFQKKKKNWYGSFRYVSILRKKVFSGARVQCFSHCGSNNLDSAVFGNADFGEIKYHSLRRTSFLKKIIYGSFRFVSNLRRKVFSGGPVNCIPLYGSSNSDSAIFGNAAFGEIKDHRFLKNF